MRPIVVFGAVASAMVCWLSARMWCGDSYAVWRLSCILGAWAPLGAAAVVLYVRATGHRESSVLAAWLVRAIGMHWVLVWLVGISDWLRGPPRAVPAWNTDVGMPLVFLAFVPVFALSVAALGWMLSLARRMAPRHPTSTSSDSDAPTPYRGARASRLSLAPAAPSRAPVLASAVGAASAWVALAAPVDPTMVLGASALALAVMSFRSPRAMAPSAVSIAAVTGALLARDCGFDLASPAGVNRFMAWPAATAAAVAVYLLVLEARLTLRRVAAG